MKKEIYVVGIGPGEKDKMTHEAYKVLEKSDVIVGYTLYVELVKEIFTDKEFLSTPMRQEIDRCRMCFDLALEGKTVSLVCSGDAGIYGMASPVLQLLSEVDEYKSVDFCVVPGITAAISGAAELGCPLNHDFCVISLSDLLTPWEAITRRLKAASNGDFAIALYNPSSHKRNDYLERACKILMENGTSKNTAAGYVENIGRENTRTVVCTLAELMEARVNMFTTVFIGNSQSEIVELPDGNRKILTKRGYAL